MAKIEVRLMVSMPYLVMLLLSNKRLILKQSSISCPEIEITLDTKSQPIDKVVDGLTHLCGTNKFSPFSSLW